MNSNNKISFITAVGMSMNLMVGAGIYAGTDIISAVAGNAGFASWLIVATIYLPTIYCISQIATYLPQANGFYDYSRLTLGRNIGFLSGCIYYFCYLTATACTLIALRDMLLLKFASSVLVKNILFFVAPLLLGIVLLNLVRMTFVSGVQFYLTIIKLMPLLFVIFLIPFFFDHSFSISGTELAAAFSSPALAPALFSYLGFEFACNLGPQIEGGAKRAAQAVITAFLLTTAICTAFHFGLLQIMGVNNLVQFQALGLPLFACKSFPTLVAPLIIVMGIAFALSYLNSANGIFTLASTTLHSLANNNLIKGSSLITRLNNNNRPHIAIFISAIIVLAICLVMPYKAPLMQLCALCFLISLILMIISLLVVLKRAKLYSRMLIPLIALCINCTRIYTQFTSTTTTGFDRLLFISLLIALIAISIIFKTATPNRNNA